MAGPSLAYEEEEDAGAHSAALVPPAAEVVERVAFRAFCRDLRAARTSCTDQQKERSAFESDAWMVLPAGRKRQCVALT